MDAHKTEFEDDSFDFIVGKGILHHLEFEVAMKEILRILKPGCYALFHEPLGDNPASKLMRLLTPQMRTRYEHPLSGRQIKWADSLFKTREHKFINFFSIPFGVLSPYVFAAPDNVMLRAADTLDSVMARSFLRNWMRSVVLLWRKAL
jgi:SAM-dependent methyltransferase